MRRTGNTSFWPTTGIVVCPTGKIVLTPTCASAASLRTAVPARAAAPPAKTVLRLKLVMGLSFLREFLCDDSFLMFVRPYHFGKQRRHSDIPLWHSVFL